MMFMFYMCGQHRGLDTQDGKPWSSVDRSFQHCCDWWLFFFTILHCFPPSPSCHRCASGPLTFVTDSMPSAAKKKQFTLSVWMSSWGLFRHHNRQLNGGWRMPQTTPPWLRPRKEPWFCTAWPSQVMGRYIQSRTPDPTDSVESRDPVCFGPWRKTRINRDKIQKAKAARPSLK